MNTRIMLDLETLGMKPGSAVVAIGAVKFGNGEIHDTFYRRIDFQSCVEAGLTIDASTVLWWLKQSEEARSEILKPGVELEEAIRCFDLWVGDAPDIEIWGNGASYDNVLLACAYYAVGIIPSWAHLSSRCYRTVKNMFPKVKLVRYGHHHNALDDARSQAIHLMQMLPNL